MEKPNYMQLWSMVRCSRATRLRQKCDVNVQHKTVKVGKRNHQFGAYSIPRESGWPHSSSDWFGAVYLLLEHLSLASDIRVLFKGLRDQRGFFCSVTSVPSYWKQPCPCLPFVPWTSSVFRLSRSFVLLLVLSLPNPNLWVNDFVGF